MNSTTKIYLSALTGFGLAAPSLACTSSDKLPGDEPPAQPDKPDLQHEDATAGDDPNANDNPADASNDDPGVVPIDCGEAGPDEVVVQTGELFFFNDEVTFRPPDPTSPALQLRWESQPGNWHVVDLHPDDRGCARHTGVHAELFYLFQYSDDKSQVTVGDARRVDLRSRLYADPNVEWWTEQVSLTFAFELTGVGSSMGGDIYCVDTDEWHWLEFDHESTAPEAFLHINKHGGRTRTVGGTLGRECVLVSYDYVLELPDDTDPWSYEYLLGSQRLPPIDLSLGDQTISVALEHAPSTKRPVTWHTEAARELFSVNHPDATFKSSRIYYDHAVEIEPDVWHTVASLGRGEWPAGHTPPDQLPMADSLHYGEPLVSSVYEAAVEEEGRSRTLWTWSAATRPGEPLDAERRPLLLAPPRDIEVDGQSVIPDSISSNLEAEVRNVVIVPGDDAAASSAEGYHLSFVWWPADADWYHVAVRSSVPQFQLPSELLLDTPLSYATVMTRACYDAAVPTQALECASSRLSIDEADRRSTLAPRAGLSRFERNARVDPDKSR
ncbi:MAG: hypothetical protein B7733_17105 [Myxococcales bacterium FL481]|nr:MAG: hypothetical protein B7733_17105 [Myxococcales bacterium FL481]